MGMEKLSAGLSGRWYSIAGYFLSLIYITFTGLSQADHIMNIFYVADAAKPDGVLIMIQIISAGIVCGMLYLWILISRRF